MPCKRLNHRGHTYEATFVKGPCANSTALMASSRVRTAGSDAKDGGTHSLFTSETLT
jgi:hypothetical protein